MDIFLHLRSETWTQWTIQAARVKVHHRPHSFEDGPVVYPANAFDSRLQGDLVPLGSSPTNSQRKDFSGWRPVTRRFRLPSLHILHVRCQFCVIRAVRRNLQFLPVRVRLRKKPMVHRDGQAQERAQAKLERNRRWFERKISTFLVRAANAPVRAANAPYGELHTSTNSRSSDHERGEHTTKRLWSGRGPGQSRSNLRRSKALR